MLYRCDVAVTKHIMMQERIDLTMQHNLLIWYIRRFGDDIINYIVCSRKSFSGRKRYDFCMSPVCRRSRTNFSRVTFVIKDMIWYDMPPEGVE